MALSPKTYRREALRAFLVAAISIVASFTNFFGIETSLRLIGQDVAYQIFADRLMDPSNGEADDIAVVLMTDADLLAQTKSWAMVGLPPQKWPSAMFRKVEENDGQQATEARRDCHEVTAG